MELFIDLTGNGQQGTAKQEQDSMARVMQAQAKKSAKNYEPTWDEVWYTGYPTTTGKHKKGIFETQLTEPDKKKLKAVREAIDNEEIGTHVESLRKFSKAHALSLYNILKNKRRDGIIKKYLENVPGNYFLVNTKWRLEEIIAEIKKAQEQAQPFAIDTETTGLLYEDRVIGMSFSFMTDKHYYIPMEHITPVVQLPKAFVMDMLREYLQSYKSLMVLHNSKFDAHMLLKESVDIRNSIYGDTQIMQQILNENEEFYALKKLVNKYGRYFGYTDESLTFEELFGKDPRAFQEADINLCTYYGCKDTQVCLMLFNWQVSMMKKQPNLYHVYFDIERKVTPACIDMENTGFKIDFEYASKYAKELTEQLAQLEAEIDLKFNGINTGSPLQLGKLLFDEWGLKDVSGKRSVGAKFLEKLAKQNSDINLILEQREIAKLLNTYVAKLPEMINPDTKRLSGEFDQAGTVTGRFSSSKPNLQNLPYPARPLIIAPENTLIFGLDYSQIEPRALAHISEDLDLREPYLKGIDLYSTLASKTFKMSYEACLEADDTTWRALGMPKHPRKMMKVGLLASMYGIGIPSLAESLKITVAEAQEFMDNFYNAYPRMVAWMAETVAFAEKNGYVLTREGRKRRLMCTLKNTTWVNGKKVVKKTQEPFIKVAKEFHILKRKVESIIGREYLESDNIWQLEIPRKLAQAFARVAYPYASTARQAVNAVIQGSASEVMKIAMILVRDYIKDLPGWKLLCTIHDEILLEIPDTATEEQIRQLEYVMAHAVEFDIPIKCDIEVSRAWGKGVPYAEWLEKGYEAFN